MTKRLGPALRLGRASTPAGLPRSGPRAYQRRLRSAQFDKLRLLVVLVAMVVPAALFFNVTPAWGQQSAEREIAFPKTIWWAKQRGVTKYRLQIASDEQFLDVFFDGPVTGEHYEVKDLSAGYYFWRVAPVDSRSLFSQPQRFFISGGVVITVRFPGRSPAVVSSRVP